MFCEPADFLQKIPRSERSELPKEERTSNNIVTTVGCYVSTSDIVTLVLTTKQIIPKINNITLTAIKSKSKNIHTFQAENP